MKRLWLIHHLAGSGIRCYHATMRYGLALPTLLFILVSVACGSSAPTLAPSYTAPPSVLRQTLMPTTTNSTVTVPTATSLVQHLPPSSTAHLPTKTARATILPTSTAPPATPTPPAVHYSPDGRYAFPVAGDLELMTWTHLHWDGSNAADIEAARHLAADSEEFTTFIQLPVVSVISGTISIADNHYGGLALLLYGDDGHTYYYGHLSEHWVTDGQVVSVGTLLGRIGNTGHNTQYIEPHLHFSIASPNVSDWRWEPDVNAAEQFLTWFDLPWNDLGIVDYPLDRVSGWPLAVPAEITRSFGEPLAQNPDQGSIDILPTADGEDPLPVYATVGGEVNVNRATVMGLRTQITNRPARTTVVYSFLLDTTVVDGDVVQRGDLIGFISPTIGLNYMLFVNDQSTDPAPTLGDPPQE